MPATLQHSLAMYPDSTAWEDRARAWEERREDWREKTREWRERTKDWRGRVAGWTNTQDPRGHGAHCCFISVIALSVSGYPPIKNNQLWSVRSQCTLAIES